jgi:hypothetical protein
LLAVNATARTMIIASRARPALIVAKALTARLKGKAFMLK